MSDIDKITNDLIKFRDDRDWDQFHNSKDLAVALSIEAAELLELFLWKSADEADIEKVKDELADILSFALLIANKYKLNVTEIVKQKISKNEIKYPVQKSKGNNKKYSDL